jgi:hypothetical protein
MTEPSEEDPWAAGRAATAAEVKEIFERHRAPGPAREHHDALPAFVRLPRFLLNKLPRRRRRAVVFGMLVLAVAVGVGVKLAYDAAQRAQLREARADRAFRAGEVRRLVADQRARLVTVGGVTGAPLLRRLETAVGADARARVRDGTLSGPIRRTVCRRGGELVNAAENPNFFRCLAVTSASVGVTLGHEYLVRVDRGRGIAVLCHNNYPPGHPEAYAISVPLSRACTGR